MAFQKVGGNCYIFKQALENRPNEFYRIICGLRDVATKIEKPVTFEGPMMWQCNFGKQYN